MRRPAFLAACAAFTLANLPALAAPASEETVHVVEQGETLNGIANRAGVSAGAIATANGLKAPFSVRIGQKLKIPREKAASVARATSSETSHTVKAGETLGGIASRTGVSVSAIAAANDLAEPYVVRVGQTLAIPRGPASVKTAARVIPAAARPAPITGGDPASETLHVVAPGETLGGIAQRAEVPRVLIAEANGLAPPYVVKVGQKLHIPRTRRHTVAAGETGFAISYQYAVPWEQIAVANGLDPQAPLQAGRNLLIPTVLNPPPTSTPVSGPAPASSPAPASAPAKSSRFLWPVSGDVRRGYATGNNYHDGLDIQAPKGTMVRAAAAGTVKFAGKEKDQFGNLVVIDHGDGWFTAYGFLSRVTVKQGAKVAAGERVGLVGSTGLAKGSELHFEVRREGKPVDPLDELPKAP